MKFRSGKEMLKRIQSGVDLYNPKTCRYVYVYNDVGAICVRYIEPNETKLVSKNAGDDYWGSVLGFGGNIYDEPLDWCESNYEGEWYGTKEWEVAA